MGYLTGKTMGPITYNVKYFDPNSQHYQTQVDSLLKVFNQSLNTYIPESEISGFNRDSAFTFQLPFFYPVLKRSQEIYNMTSGAFDPTVMPVINAWGFGPEKEIKKDSAYLDSLMTFVGFNNIDFNEKQVWKKDRRAELDFSAVAKGYGVDEVAHYLKDKGIENLFVEIGGEVYAKGKNLQKDTFWSVGILDPNSDELNQFYYAIVTLENKAMATSGNYFNYHIIDSVKYGHTIDPTTGFPIVHSLLSASIFADDCMTADAVATACMVMGVEKSKAFFNEHPEMDAFLIYTDQDGNMQSYATPGIKDKIEKVEQ